MPEKRKFGKWVILGSILVVILIIALLLHLYLNVMPEKAIEREFARIRAQGEPVTLEELALPEIPDAENAAIIYEQAFGLYYEPPKKEERKLLAILDKDLSTWTEEDIKAIREYVEKNDDCLRLLYQAANYDKCRFPLDYSQGFELLLPLPDLSKMRAFARLLAKDALLKAKGGKINEALESSWAGLGIGKALLDEPFLISQLVRYATDGLIFSCLQEILNENDAESEILNRLLKELDIEVSREAFARSLQGERCLQIDILEALIKDSARLWEMIQIIGGGAAPPSLVRRTGGRILLRLARPFFRRDEIFALSVTRKAIDLSKLPYHQAKADLQKLAQQLDRPPKYCIFSAMLIPALTRGHLQEARHEAKLGLAQLALGLKIFKAEKGKYPEALSELVPQILPELPQDPFTGTDFVYKCEAEGFLVYSLGENGTDEGGKWDDANPYQHDIPWRSER